MKKFLLFSLAYCLFQNVNSQVYNAGSMLANYSDVNPDVLLHYVYFPYTHQVYDLKIFGSSNDIEFVADGSSSPGGSSAYINIKSLNPDVFISLGRLDSVFDSTSHSWLITKIVEPLNAGEPINASGRVWDNSMLYISDHSASFGWTKDVNDWIGSDKYVGLKYDKGNAVAYAWIRLGCVSKDSCYVKEFSSTALIAGIKETADINALIYPNPSIEKFIVCFDPVFPAEEICVYNMMGNCVLSRKVAHSLKEEIDLGTQPAGIYFLSAKTKNGVLNRKIIRE
jgi:hypothetical protein